MGRFDDVLRRLAELERWRREHEVEHASEGDRLLRSKWFWIVLALALVGLGTGSGAVARLWGWF